MTTFSDPYTIVTFPPTYDGNYDMTDPGYFWIIQDTPTPAIIADIENRGGTVTLVNVPGVTLGGGVFPSVYVLPGSATGGLPVWSIGNGHIFKLHADTGATVWDVAITGLQTGQNTFYHEKTDFGNLILAYKRSTDYHRIVAHIDDETGNYTEIADLGNNPISVAYDESGYIYISRHVSLGGGNYAQNRYKYSSSSSLLISSSYYVLPTGYNSVGFACRNGYRYEILTKVGSSKLYKDGVEMVDLGAIKLFANNASHPYQGAARVSKSANIYFAFTCDPGNAILYKFTASGSKSWEYALGGLSSTPQRLWVNDDENIQVVTGAGGSVLINSAGVLLETDSTFARKALVDCGDYFTH